MNYRKLVKLCKKEKLFDILDIVFFSLTIIFLISLVPVLFTAKIMFIILHILSIAIFCVLAIIFSKKALKCEEAIYDYVSLKIMDCFTNLGYEVAMIDGDEYLFFVELKDKTNYLELENKLEEMLQNLREASGKFIEVYLI